MIVDVCWRRVSGFSQPGNPGVTDQGLLGHIGDGAPGDLLPGGGQPVTGLPAVVGSDCVT